jgi:hypothetical protein
MRLVVLGILIFVLAAAQAQAWADRAGDAALTGATLRASLIRRTHAFFHGGQARFSDGGAYSCTYGRGGKAFGTFEIFDDGRVCTIFRHGFERCDRYLLNAGRLVLLTEDGLRFPIR